MAVKIIILVLSIALLAQSSHSHVAVYKQAPYTEDRAALVQLIEEHMAFANALINAALFNQPAYLITIKWTYNSMIKAGKQFGIVYDDWRAGKKLGKLLLEHIYLIVVAINKALAGKNYDNLVLEGEENARQIGSLVAKTIHGDEQCLQDNMLMHLEQTYTQYTAYAEAKYDDAMEYYREYLKHGYQMGEMWAGLRKCTMEAMDSTDTKQSQMKKRRN